MNQEQQMIFNDFMALYNELDGLLKKVYSSDGKQSVMIMYINDIAEPESSRMNTIRCARNVYIHGTKFDNEPLIRINGECIVFLRGRIEDVKQRIAKLSQSHTISELSQSNPDSDIFEYRERTLHNGESINDVKETYGWYGWQFVECRGLEELESEPTMLFKRDKKQKGYDALNALWLKRIEKFDELDKVRTSNKTKHSQSAVISSLKIVGMVFAEFAIIIGLAIAAIFSINALANVVAQVFVGIFAFALFIFVIAFIPNINRCGKRWFGKNKNALPRTETQIAQEITYLDSQAKNITDYVS